MKPYPDFQLHALRKALDSLSKRVDALERRSPMYPSGKPPEAPLRDSLAHAKACGCIASAQDSERRVLAHARAGNTEAMHRELLLTDKAYVIAVTWLLTWIFQ